LTRIRVLISELNMDSTHIEQFVRFVVPRYKALNQAVGSQLISELLVVLEAAQTIPTEVKVIITEVTQGQLWNDLT
jgi:hypothetical protein